MKLEPQYSGPASRPFWRAVNKLIETDKAAWSACYSLGVALQNLENQVLKELTQVRRVTNDEGETRA